MISRPAPAPQGSPEDQPEQQAIWSESPGLRYSVWGRVGVDLLGIEKGFDREAQTGLFLKVMKRYRWAQRRQAVGNYKPCTGLCLTNKRNPRAPKFRCHNIFCPACWHVTQMRIADLVASLEFDWWYIRETSWPEIGEDMPRKVLTRFRGEYTGYVTIGWLISPGVGEFEGRYQYIGVFGSNGPLPIQDRFGLKGGVVRADGMAVGGVETTSFPSKDHMMEVWADRVKHPSILRYHPEYVRWVEHTTMHLYGEAKSYVRRHLKTENQ